MIPIPIFKLNKAFTHSKSKSLELERKADAEEDMRDVAAPDGLGSGSFLCESVFCTAPHDNLIVSSTTRRSSVLGAVSLGARCGPVLGFGFSFFSGVSQTVATPVTALC